MTLPRFSIVILTFNEEINVGECVRNAREFSDDVVVVDSNSTDSTVELARAEGARVFQHPFGDFAAQRNWAVSTIEFRHRWIFHLDADERLTPALARECRRLAARDERSGYLVACRQMVDGRWLRHASCFPIFQMRFHKLGEVQFIQKGHGQREGESTRGYGHLRHPYLHYPLSKGLSEWFARHNGYSSREAREALNGWSHRSTLDLFREFRRTEDELDRWRVLKRISTRVPFPMASSFLYYYLVRRGFLDGRPGLTYCRLQALYQEMIRLKIRELQRRESEERD
jgi:glycosyltransferase involved in cell wall biosynthesis